MLSNKLTFSLVFLVMFAVAFVATPVIAQEVTAVFLGDETTIGTGLDSGQAATITDHLFTIVANNTSPVPIDPNNLANSGGPGILTGNDSDHTARRPRPITAAAESGAAINYVNPAVDMPDLHDFFAKGGTVEVLVPINPASQQFEQADARWHDVVMTEIMWGLDEGEATPISSRQWLELYNNTGSTKGGHNDVYKDKDGRGEATAMRNVGGYPDPGNVGQRIGEIVLLFTVNKYFGAKAHEDVPTEWSWVSFNNVRWQHYRTRPGPNAPAAIGDFRGNNHGETASGTNEHYYKVVDRVSNLGRGGRQGPLPGQSGRVAGNTGANNNPSVSLISAYRKRHLQLDDETGIGEYHDGHMFANGTKLDGWHASWVSPNLVRRINITEAFIATPGAEHFTPVPPVPTVVPVNVVFNEIRNDTSEDDLDWIELYNNSSVAVDIGAYEIGLIEGHGKEKDLIQLQDKDDDGVDIKLGAGEYLLIVNTDPEDSIIADGKDITVNASNRLNLQGASHLYFFPKLEWQLPNDKEFLLVLRSAKDKNNGPDAIQDIVGDLRITDLRDDIDTKVWPLRNWDYKDDDGGTGTKVGEKKDADTKGDGASFGSKGRTSITWYRAKYEAGNWWHQDHWKKMGYTGGIGYKKDLDNGVHLEAPGTPGYVNTVQGTQADHMKADAGAAVTISEIMYDAGRAWDLVQWIELYNSSMTQAVDISGWTLDIRNAADEEEPQRSFVDDEFEFESGTIIPPNRTLLVVSATGATNVPSNRVYDLFAKHGNDLGLKNLARRTYLLSKTGFKLTLMDDAVTPVEVDTAGNASLDGARVSVGWALPAVSEEGEARHSIIRLYGGIYNPTKDDGTGYEAAGDGAMEDSWNQSGLESGNIGIYYGHTDDFSTPGFRRGSALPVSLSSFRPVRDKATGEVLIRWITASELNNAGFNILRSETKTGKFKVVNVKGIIPGHGTTSEKHVYEWTDTTAKPNVVYYYRIEDVSFDGERATLATTHLRGNVTAAGKVTTTWGDLKHQK